jgi:hypothetical protein
MARNFGKQIEHWNGVDFSANARLQNGIMLQGGVSSGRTTTDNCEIVANAGGNPSLRNCHVQAAFLTQVKLLGTYMVPKIGMNIAATVQSTPGPVVNANRTYLNAEVQPSLGRPLSAGAANVVINLLNPGQIYSDRVNQFDLRFGKTMRLAQRRVSVNLDLYNALNANPVMQENAAYAVWRTPQRIMDGRLAKISGQFDF